ncbi:hypothetical protein [Bosea sp. NBC_00550]|uniref:hypothetical protein n=1 Tax=Bosea sp. NBC_00550 TaxID=2969621 RepID=UPI00222E6BD2|nr:hypothetical protein [Bosea sp. NBC_00550]UZF94348.1 hypothetical protein NWE53_09275 [Bosea sp. NBC_00550]
MTAPGRRFSVFRLSESDAIRIGAFREEMFVGPQNSGNRGSLALTAEKACRLGDLSDKPILDELSEDIRDAGLCPADA